MKCKLLILGLCLLIVHPAFAKRRRDRTERAQLPQCVLALTNNEGSEGKDWSSTGTSVTDNNAATYTVDAKGDGYFDYNGSSSYLRYADADALSCINAMSANMWMRRDSSDAEERVFEKNSLDNTKKEYVFKFTSAGPGKDRFYLFDSGYSDNMYRESPDFNAGSDWVMVTLTWDGGSAHATDIHIFFDTVEVDDAGGGAGVWNGRGNGPGVLQFGRKVSAASDYFDGDIDEVTFYNRVLTTAEIGHLYQQGKAAGK